MAPPLGVAFNASVLDTTQTLVDGFALAAVVDAIALVLLPQEARV